MKNSKSLSVNTKKSLQQKASNANNRSAELNPSGTGSKAVSI